MAGPVGSCNDPAYQTVKRCVRTGKGADSHANAAIGSDFGPIGVTGFLIQFPFANPVDDDFVIHGQ